MLLTRGPRMVRCLHDCCSMSSFVIAGGLIGAMLLLLVLLVLLLSVVPELLATWELPEGLLVAQGGSERLHWHDRAWAVCAPGRWPC